MSELICPICNHDVSTSPVKSWKYATYEVKRYQCHNCKSKFNLYQNPKKTFTLPKRK